MQQLAVGIILIAAVVFIVAKYLPASWRARLVARLERQGHARAARALDGSAGCASGSGCDSCQRCEDTPADAPPADAGKRVIPLRVKR